MDPVLGGGEDRTGEGVEVIDGLGAGGSGCEKEMVLLLLLKGESNTLSSGSSRSQRDHASNLKNLKCKGHAGVK